MRRTFLSVLFTFALCVTSSFGESTTVRGLLYNYDATATKSLPAQVTTDSTFTGLNVPGNVWGNPIALGSGTSFSVDPKYRFYTATASGNYTITLATNSVASTNIVDFEIAIYDSAGGKTGTLSSGGTGGASFAAPVFEGYALTNVAGTNTLFFHWDGVWHVSQNTAKIATSQLGDGTPTGTGSLVLNNGPQLIWDESALADDTWVGIVSTNRNAGEALTQWDIVYLSSSSTWLKADADASGKFPASGIVVSTTSSNAVATVLLTGAFRDDGGTSWTVGGRLYLSTTAGAMTQTSPSAASSCSQAVGFATTAHRVIFRPDMTYFEN